MHGEFAPLQEILTLLVDRTEDPSHLFREGLSLLVRLTGADRAMLAAQTPYGLEIACWATYEGTGTPEGHDLPATCFCQAVLENPLTPLLIPDAWQDPLWQGRQAVLELGIHAYLGVPLGPQPLGVLSLQYASPRHFETAEIQLMELIAAIFTQRMETELLREDVRKRDEILALHNAMADDHALESPHSQLPTRRYLDIWVRANLSRARRSGEKIGVVIFPGDGLPLVKLSQQLRGEDLLVDLGDRRILLAAPDSNRPLMEVLLKRVHPILGSTPMGATLCDPEKDLEGERPSLEPAIQRASQALAVGLAKGAKKVTWKLSAKS